MSVYHGETAKLREHPARLVLQNGVRNDAVAWVMTIWPARQLDKPTLLSSMRSCWLGSFVGATLSAVQGKNAQGRENPQPSSPTLDDDPSKGSMVVGEGSETKRQSVSKTLEVATSVEDLELDDLFDLLKI